MVPAQIRNFVLRPDTHTLNNSSDNFEPNPRNSWTEYDQEKLEELEMLETSGQLSTEQLHDLYNLRLTKERVFGSRETRSNHALKSASEPYKSSTRLGHALSKHAGRNPERWGTLTGHPYTWHIQALKHFNEIMNGPGIFEIVTNSRGIKFLEKVLPDGRGLRLDLNGSFKGFINE